MSAIDNRTGGALIYEVGPSAFAYESVTVAASSTALTAATYSPASNAVAGYGPAATRAVLSLENGQLRYTVDGTTPSATVGHLMDIGDVIEIYGLPDIAAFRAYRTAGVSCTLQVTYSR